MVLRLEQQRRQYLYICTSKVSTLSKGSTVWSSASAPASSSDPKHTLPLLKLLRELEASALLREFELEVFSLEPERLRSCSASHDDRLEEQSRIVCVCVCV